jgi:hypothetical protein
VLGEWRYSSTHSLTSALDGGKWSASRTGRFTPREGAPGTDLLGGWVGPRAGYILKYQTSMFSQLCLCEPLCYTFFTIFRTLSTCGLFLVLFLRGWHSKDMNTKRFPKPRIGDKTRLFARKPIKSTFVMYLCCHKILPCLAVKEHVRNGICVSPSFSIFSFL